MSIAKNVIAILAVSFVISAVVSVSVLDAHWEKFKVTYNKNYETPELESFRKQIFVEKLKKIEAHNENYNNGLVSHTTGINQFADMSTEEVKQVMCTLKPEPRDPNVPVFFESDDDDLAEEVDWRTKGVVTRVKDQGGCGSCYAFSAVCSLEGQHAIKHQKLVSLSEKNLVDCSHKEGNRGCAGGLMTNCFTYVKNNKGIDTEESYPYSPKRAHCNFTKEGIGATCDGYINVHENEKALQKAVARIGPIAVGVATGGSFTIYKKGIFDDNKCGCEINHGVAVVGYGKENGTKFWIIKNSWGETWGEKGYMRIVRGKDLCKISQMASYPWM